MSLSSLAIIALSLSANNTPIFQGTPNEVVQTIRYNAAKTDLWLQDHRVEIKGVVSRIEKDGLGNYIAIMETRIEEPAAEVSGTIRFKFAPSERDSLAAVLVPDQKVTIQGDFRFVRDLLRRMARNTVTVDLLNCQLVPGEPVLPPLPPEPAKPAPVPEEKK
ncbi:MAG: hypothetical protein ACKVP0_03455 [Pirellulaceae bacterium]